MYKMPMRCGKGEGGGREKTWRLSVLADRVSCRTLWFVDVFPLLEWTTHTPAGICHLCMYQGRESLSSHN
ncbi:hypothetical protein LDENG_00280750 [Lucifuga dentata]|nr:hypothetical protein LDENG_00280750 [Lucifuga dentata]